MPFEFAEPAPSNASSNPDVNDAIEFAAANKGKWFVYDSVEPVPTDVVTRRKKRAALSSRANYVKRTAAERGLELEAATRIENDEKIVSYLRGVDNT